MDIEKIKNYCLGKWKAYEDSPFGDVPICYRLNKKIFAQIYPNSHDYKITLKCTSDFGQFYRQIFPGVVVRGYHCPTAQQPYWNTIYLNDFPEENRYRVIVSQRATQMLVSHAAFLAQVSPEAAERSTAEFEKSANSLKIMPQRCPWLTGEYIPRNVYRFILFEKRL